MLENAKYLVAEKSRLYHDAEQMKVNGRKKKLAEAMIKGGFGETLAKLLGDLMVAESTGPIPNVTDANQMNFDTIMKFDAGDGSDISLGLSTAVHHYQESCFQSVSEKFATLHRYLETEEKKPSAATPVRVFGPDEDHHGKPDLSVALKLIEGTAYEDHDGSNPWLVAQRSFAERVATAAFPLPCFPTLIQLAKESYAPVSFLVTPVKALAKAGLTVLADFSSFSNHETAINVIQESSLLVTLQKSSELLYLPQGFLPLPIGREPFSEKTPKTCCYWTKTFFQVQQSLKLDHQVHAAMELLNHEYLRRLSGQRIWKHRLDIYEKFQAGRQSCCQSGVHVPNASR